MKAGKLSSKEREFIVEKHLEWKIEKIAKSLNRSEALVEKTINQLKSAAETQEVAPSVMEEFERVKADLAAKNLELTNLKKQINKKPKGVTVFDAAKSAEADRSLARLGNTNFREDCMISLNRPVDND